MAERYPREWFHGGGHYTDEDLARLDRLYPPRPPPRPRTDPPPVRARPPRPLLKAVWTCQHCGKIFPGYTRRARRYCSDRCEHAARWRRRSRGPC